MLALVIYTIGTWEGFHRRPMLEALARNLRGRGCLLVVEPPLALLNPGNLRDWRPLARAVIRGTQQLAENLWLVRQTTVRRSQTGFTASRRTVRAALARISPRADRIAALVFRPEQNVLLGLAGEEAVVYECYDEYRVDESDQPVPGVREKEAVLLEAATVVLTTSLPLWESRSKEHTAVYYTPNGVDFSLFAKAREASLSIPAEIAGLKQPVVGYVGNFAAWLDTAMIEQVAEALPQFSFAFVGPVTAGEAAARLGRLPNVHFLGTKPRFALPGYVKAMAVTTNLASATTFSANVMPLKVPEYLAAGKPVVARPVPSLKDLNDVLYLANDAEEAVACLQRALAEDGPELADRRQARARQYDWDVLTKKTAEIILESCG